MLQARDNTKELSRSNVNAARSLEQTSRDAASNVRQNLRLLILENIQQ